MKDLLPKKAVTWVLLGIGIGIAVLSIIQVLQRDSEPTPTPPQNSFLNLVSNQRKAQTVSIDTRLPSTWQEELTAQLQNYNLVQEDSADADVIIQLTTKGNSNEDLPQWVYVPVTNFSSLMEAITLEELQNAQTIYTLREDEAIVSEFMQEEVTTIDTVEELLEILETDDIAIVPFDALAPQFKVLALDGKNILSKEITNREWPFIASIQVDIAQTRFEEQKEKLVNNLTPSNRMSENLASVVFTGVTAISRGVEAAITSNGNDPLFPARAVMDELSKADITHIDNENPLFESCVPEREGIVLCGKARSIEALKAVGADVIDLTGNHQNDYGPSKNLESIALLEEAGMEYFGGGKDKEDAAKILYKTVNGTTFAFLGYNYFDSLNGPSYVSLAQEDHPGSNYYSEEKLKEDIANARENADIVIVDYQFIETYSYTPLDVQKEVFRQTIDDGADLVMGVQSHQPQSVEFYNDRMIFYGLGNFFFDQMWSYETRQGIIPRLTFNEGELVSVEILTTLLYDYGQPRFTHGEEREQLLKIILPEVTTL